MRKIKGILWLAVLFFSLSAYADDAKEPVSVHMFAYHIVSTQNGEKRLDAKEAKPGDVLEYVAAYHNRSKHGISGLKATLPIPEGVVFEKGSSRPRHALASVDGKSFRDIPLKRRVKQKDGTWKEELIPLEAYRFLRWELGDLHAGDSKKVSARVRLIPVQ